MTISLKNHEDRIKALEALGGGNLKKVVLAENTGNTCNLEQSVQNFDLVEIQCNNTYGPARKVVTILVVSNIVLNQVFNIGSTSQGKENDWAAATFKSWTQLVYTSASSHSGFWRVTGLKLYYSFSYNIIYKILRSKISRLYQKFTLLKQKECEIKWL